jgi:CheY-like chemotaxis protein
MVIDDSDLARELVCEALTALNLSVTSRATAVGAQAAILREQPDVVLLDVSMPLMNGEDLTRALRSHPASSRTIVLLYSARSPEELSMLAERCGADGFVTKDDVTALASEVANWIARRRAWTKGPSDVLVACGFFRNAAFAPALSPRISCRVTDSGGEALRLMFSRQAPGLLVLGTRLSDVSPDRVLRALVERDVRWRERIVVLRESDETPVWSLGLPSIEAETPTEEVIALLARLLAAA